VISPTDLRSRSRGAGTTGHARHAWVLLTAILGVAALLLRSRVLTLPTPERDLALICIYSALLISSVLIPVAADTTARMSPVLVTCIGLGAVILAALAAGRPPAQSFAPLALPISILAAVAEEALFRRVAYGWLSRYGAAIAVFGSALLFAAVHVPLYGVAAFPVDLGAGLLFSWQRWASGRWEVAAGTHAAANFVAVMMR
jgi:membrane protease YdiL (CAAX protease family)